VSIDYTLNYDCDVKRALGGPGGFEQAVKDHAHLSTMREIMEGDPTTKDALADHTVHQLARIDEKGMQVYEKVTGRQVRERGEVLLQYQAQCKECPANLSDVPAGCSPCIHYPISAAAEDWLMDLLPADLESDVRGLLFKQFVKDFGRNGKVVDGLRKSEVFFELRSPAVDTWGKGLFGKTTCTSSMIIGNLCFVGEVEPTHGLLMCLFLGAVRLPESGIPGSNTKAEWVMDIESLPSEPSIQQFAWMLRYLYLAFTMGVTVSVSP
jgi:hypothetical protein